MSDILCKERLRGGGYFLTTCTRAAYKDGYCKQHHPDAVAAAKKKRDAAFNAKWEATKAASLAQRETKAALERDARRYRWLRDTAPWNSPVVIVDTAEAPDDRTLYCKEQLDAVIDAAISKETT